MPVSKLAEMTWEEARDLDGERAIAILPVGAIEAHGPHLPLGTDVIIAEAMARAGANRIAARGHHVVVLPAIAYTPAPFAADFPGTVSLRSTALSEMIVDVARALARTGIARLVIANSHLDPEHIRAIHAAVRAIEDEELIAVSFPDITRRPWASRLTDEFKSGACHAGQYESSVVMAERPDLVRESLRTSLEPVSQSLSEAIEAGLSSFVEAGGPRAYFGYPADATADEGMQTVDVLGAILEEAALDEPRE